MGCAKEEELGVQENARGESDSGGRRTRGAEEMETNGSPPGAGGRGLHSPDEGSRVVLGGLHRRGSFRRPQAWPLKSTALSAPPRADLTRPGSRQSALL